MNKKLIYPDFKNYHNPIKEIEDVQWQCLNCRADTKSKEWLGCCSQECLKHYLEKERKQIEL